MSELSANYRDRPLRGVTGARPNWLKEANSLNFPQVSAAVSRVRVAGEKTNPLTAQLTAVSR